MNRLIKAALLSLICLIGVQQAQAGVGHLILAGTTTAVGAAIGKLFNSTGAGALCGLGFGSLLVFLDWLIPSSDLNKEIVLYRNVNGQVGFTKNHDADIVLSMNYDVEETKDRNAYFNAIKESLLKEIYKEGNESVKQAYEAGVLSIGLSESESSGSIQSEGYLTCTLSPSTIDQMFTNLAQPNCVLRFCTIDEFKARVAKMVAEANAQVKHNLRYVGRRSEVSDDVRTMFQSFFE